jgi:subfamily B ATP-binding cassette protein MsbA
MTYARPYYIRLSIGILAGLVGGGALLGLLRYTPGILAPFEQKATAVQVQTGQGTNTSAAVSFTGDFSKVENVAKHLGWPMTNNDGSVTWQFIILSLFGLPVFVLLKSLTNYLNRYYMRWIGARVVRDLRDELFNTLQEQSLKFFGKSDVGQLISKSTNDTAVVENVISISIADLSRAPIEIAAALIYVVVSSYSNNLLGLVLLVSLAFPLCIIPIIVLGKYVRRYTHRALERISDLISRMHENFTGIRVVKAFHTEQREAKRFENMNANYFKSIIKALRAELLMTPLMEGIAILLTCVFFVVCYAKGVKLSQIVPIGLASVVAYRPIKQLAQLNASIQRGAAALDRIFSLLDTRMVLPEAPDAQELDSFSGEIVFERVDFAYEENASKVLEGIDIKIPKGSVVALVGETGSGKTTLANLLARFYDPTAGQVMIDGKDLRGVKIASLRKLIGVVTQETILFNDTIASNISYGSESATMDQIVEAAKQANAHDFIVADPQGYHRVVGEKGFVLSGGERQRVAIARAILKNPPILILDEAMSALDTVTERLVQEAITRVMKNRTVFAIAHRLSTIKHADQILVIDHGRVIERGTHEELLAGDGMYRRLCEFQFEMAD